MHASKLELQVPKMPVTSRWKTEQVSPKKLVDYGREYMPLHSGEQMKVIADTIRKFGFALPVVTDGRDSIIWGPGSVKAAIRLRYSTIPTVPLQWMTEQERRLLSIGMIRFARLGNWSPEILDLDVRGQRETQLNTEFKINGGFCDARGNMYYPKLR
ncbi:hypothetical protein [Ruegeria arenilitoris]|uniref:hypothetical protein n=1 Tax=Ruegeria arenilitoris TaxID=1173585 RepID=UPI001479DAAD|nr:hypothetical protein [Ruegeria arenilitoris]